MGILDSIRSAVSAERGYLPGPAAPRAPRVWATGGGKGGVGKSVFTSSLAISLASRGERCVVVDADLGGANVHTLLGVPNPRLTLSHFLAREVESLSDVMCPTPVPNLSIISGARGLLEMANPKHTQKEKLLRHIRRLDVEHVFLDLSAGSSFNVLDFFLAADDGILVVVPEPTSIENAYYFLKTAFFRSLRNAARQHAVREALGRVLDVGSRRRVRSPRELIEGVGEIDAAAGRELQNQAAGFSPLLVVNKTRTVEHRRVGFEISAVCKDFLGTEVSYLGALERDECVRTAVAERKPVLKLFPGSTFSRDLEAIASRMLAGDPQAAEASIRAAEPNYLRRRNLPQQATLATQCLVEEEKKQVRQERLDTAYARARERRPDSRPSARAALPSLDVAEPGAYLRRCREHLGRSIPEIVQRTRLLAIDAIENERYEDLPPDPYLRGQILQYARELGIEEAPALAASFVGRYRLWKAKRRSP